MTTMHNEERLAARKVLGFSDQNGVVIPLTKRSPDALLETIYLKDCHHSAQLAGCMKTEERLLVDLKAARKAKSLANARADRAEAAMRAMLDSFKEGEIK